MAYDANFRLGKLGDKYQKLVDAHETLQQELDQEKVSGSLLEQRIETDDNFRRGTFKTRTELASSPRSELVTKSWKRNTTS